MTKHTPGPWKVVGETWEGDGAGGVLVESATGEGVAFCTSWTDRGEPDAAQPSDFANAILIAAAPDLLEALTDLLTRFNSSELTMETLENAKAAIAKAKGETPHV